MATDSWPSSYLHLRRPGGAPTAGLHSLAGEYLAGACWRSGMSLVEGTVGAGAAFDSALRLGGVLDVFDRLRFFGIWAQQRGVGRESSFDWQGSQRQEWNPKGEALEQAPTGQTRAHGNDLLTFRAAYANGIAGG